MSRFLSLAIFLLLMTSLAACARIGPISGPSKIHPAGCDRNECGSGAQDKHVGRIDLPFKARGNEPGWILVIDSQIMLDWAYGTHQTRMPRPEPIHVDDSVLYATATKTHALKVRITDSICQDSMTGMPYPNTVSVTIDGTRLAGCGGNPESLLVGDEWVVEDVTNRGIIDTSHMTLNFDGNGHLSGHGGCNSYHATYDITGEGLKIGPIATTRKACAPALNNQENRFLHALKNARHFNIDNTGKLIIHTASGKTIEAYPAG